MRPPASAETMESLAVWVTARKRASPAVTSAAIRPANAKPAAIAARITARLVSAARRTRANGRVQEGLGTRWNSVQGTVSSRRATPRCHPLPVGAAPRKTSVPTTADCERANVSGNSAGAVSSTWVRLPKRCSASSSARVAASSRPVGRESRPGERLWAMRIP